MDEHRFDSLARLLGQAADRRQGLKAAAAAVFGGSAAVAALEADAKGKGTGRDARAEDAAGEDDVDDEKHRKICSKKKPCPSGWSCVKGKKTKHGHHKRKKRTCVCTTGITCGTACCAAGQTCDNGVCSDSPDPTTCIAKGEACKGVGRSCCAGLKCASGQGGDADVACYVPKRGACQTTADCAYGTTCQDGVCMGPVPAGEPCETGDICIQGACGPYQSGNPAGTFCLIATGQGGCTADNQCVGQYCQGGVCRVREADTTQACGQGGTVCANPLDTCTTYQSGTPAGQFCLRAASDPCDTDAECRAGACGSDDRCKAWTGEQCGINAGGIGCANPLDSCVGYDSGTPTGFHCLRQLGEPCSGGADCQSGTCTNDVCAPPIATGAACISGQSACADPKATCTTFQSGATNGQPGTYCLLPDNTSPDTTALASGCTANGQCTSGQCGMVNPTDVTGYCVPLACLVCKPFAGSGACKYSTVDAAADAEFVTQTLPLHGVHQQVDIPVYAGTYQENLTLPDGNFYVHSCVGRPLLTAPSGLTVTVDVESKPEKFVTFEKFDFTGNPDNTFQMNGCGTNDCLTGTEPAWANVELKNVETLYTAGNHRMKLLPYVKFTVVDSHLRNGNIRSDSGTAFPNYIHLIRTTHQGGAVTNSTGIAVLDKGARVTLEDSTVTGWADGSISGGIIFLKGLVTSGPWDSTLTITGNTVITANDTSANPVEGAGIRFAYAGVVVSLPDNGGTKTIYDYSTENPNAQDDTDESNCWDAGQSSAAACCDSAGGFTSGATCPS